MRLSKTRWARSALLAIPVLVSSSCLMPSALAASGHRHTGSHRASHRVAHQLSIASGAARAADRALVADALNLKHCLLAHHARRAACLAGRHALQGAGSRLARTERRLARVEQLSASNGARSARTGTQEIPHVTVAGQTLQWNRVYAVTSYVFVRKVPGQSAQYSVIRSTSIKPPPVPGKTVHYSVRTAAWKSLWAPEVAISYPAATPPVPVSDRQTAPAMSISGNTILWSKIADVSSYVLVRKVPGQADQYSEVSSTSVTPAVAPGATVKFSVRTAVEGSAWAPEVAISYPGAGAPPAVTPPPVTPPPVTPPVTEPPAGSVKMDVALDIGGWTWASAINDEAGAVRYVRSSFKHFNSDSQMELLAKAGVTLMPLFGEGGTLAGYDNSGFFNEIVTWFKRYGHGGTFWAGKPADLGATTAELINEPGNPYFYPDYNNYSLYANMTKAVHSALESNFAPAVRPKLLVSYDGGFNGSPYGRAIFAAGAVADGVTVHPYGGHGSESALGGHERVVQAHNETGLPVYVTEVGWPTALGQPATGDSLQWSEQQQAANTTGFIDWARSLGYVADVTYFNYADYGSNNWYGVVDGSGKTHKADYYALKAATAGA